MSTEKKSPITGIENLALTTSIAKLTAAAAPYLEFEKRMMANFEPFKKAQADMKAMAEKLAISSDAFVAVKGLSESVNGFAVELEKTLELRDMSKVLAKLKENADALAKLNLAPLVVAPYIPMSSRELLKKENVSFADATGNFLVNLPGKLFLQSNDGAKSDPNRSRGRQSNTLKGNAPARVLSYLIDNNVELPLSLPRLIKLAESSASTGYRVVEVLEKADALSLENGRITSIDWEKILELWSEDYSYFGNNKILRFYDPRGRENTLKNLIRIKKSEYALTGSYAAQEYRSYAPPMQLTMYARYPLQLAEELGLMPLDEGDIFIAATAFDSIFDRSKVINNISVASVSQIALDLLSGPGRNPSEGYELVAWMKKNQEDWRRGKR